MVLAKTFPFVINSLNPNLITLLTIEKSVVAGQAPRGIYFQVDRYQDSCWYTKNHYDDSELQYGQSTIQIIDNFGESIKQLFLDHLIFRLKRASKSAHFVALTFDLKLHSYSPSGECIAYRDISKNIADRYEVRCVDLTEYGGSIFYSKDGSIRRLNQNLEEVLTWEAPLKTLRDNESSYSTAKEALSVLGLAQGPSLSDIKTAFRRSILRVHPDLHPDDPLATDKTRIVVESYEILMRGKLDLPTDNEKSYSLVSFGPQSEGISATQIQSGTENLYVGCYSGKFFILYPNGTYKLFYHCHSPVRKIKEIGKYLYVFCDHFWDILVDGISINRILGGFRETDIVFENGFNAEAGKRKVKLYSLGGMPFGEIEFNQNIAGVFSSAERLKIVTANKTYIYFVRPPTDYNLLTESNLFLP